MNEFQEYIKINEMFRKRQYRKLLFPRLKNIENKYLKYLSRQNKKKYEIVVAKYKEDISWSKPYQNLITIYNKSDKYFPGSIKLTNLGRESQTYLYHIIKNWDNLAEITLFTQGELSSEHNPFPVPVYLLSPSYYVSNIREVGIEFRDGNGNHLKHSNKWLREYKKKEMSPAIITFSDFWSIFSQNKIDYNKLCWSHGAIFSVSKKLIKQNSLDLYIYLYKLVSNHKNPEEGHYFERCWYYIFNCGYLKNNIIPNNPGIDSNIKTATDTTSENNNNLTDSDIIQNNQNSESNSKTKDDNNVESDKNLKI